MTVTATIWGKTGKSYESFHPILSPGAIVIAGRVTGTAAALLRQVDITYTLYLKNAEGKELPGLIFVPLAVLNRERCEVEEA